MSTFRMVVIDSFRISGRGTAVSGVIEGAVPVLGQRLQLESRACGQTQLADSWSHYPPAPDIHCDHYEAGKVCCWCGEVPVQLQCLGIERGAHGPKVGQTVGILLGRTISVAECVAGSVLVGLD